MDTQTLPNFSETGKRKAGKKPFFLLLYGAGEAAKACNVSLRTWRSWNALGFVPEPVLIGTSLFWRVDELAQWIEAGCPKRDEWNYRPRKSSENSCPFAQRSP